MKIREPHFVMASGLIFALLVAALMLAAAFSDARAHDSWINQGGYRNSAGQFCCGEGDCFMVEPVRAVPGGYFIAALGEVVPYREAQPSQDGKFWRCRRPDGSRRCFFAPPPST